MKIVVLVLILIVLSGCRSIESGQGVFLRTGRSGKGGEVAAPRQLSSSRQMGIFNESELSEGYVVIYMIGIVYLMGMIYILFSRFINAIIEDLVYMIDSENEVLRPVVYSALNGGLALIGCMVTLFMEQPSIGVAQTIGIDALNILYLFAAIVYSNYHKQESSFDKWTLLRDAFFYILGLTILVLAFIMQSFAWYMGFALMFYYFFFYMSISRNDSLKETVLKGLGIVKEDDDFNSDDHFNFRRRRTSITVCNLQGCIPENSDQVFAIKLNRLVSVLKTSKTDPKEYKIYYDFQRIVYKVIYSLRNHTKLEKLKRAELINSLTNKKKKKIDQSTHQYQYRHQNNNSLDEEISNINEERQQDNMNANGKENSKEEHEDLQLINKISNSVNQNGQGLLENMPQGQDMNYSFDKQEEEEKQKYTLTWPQTGKKDQVMFLLYYPILLFLQLLPDHKRHPSLKKLIFSMLINFVLLVGLVVLVELLTYYISQIIFLRQNCLGMLPIAFLFNCPFMNYNIVISKTDKDIDFMQSFMHLAIFKIGMVIGPTWFLASFLFNSVQLGFHHEEQKKLGYATLVVLLCYVMTILCTFFNNCKIDKKLAKFHFIIFFVFIVATFFVFQGM